MRMAKYAFLLSRGRSGTPRHRIGSQPTPTRLHTESVSKIQLFFGGKLYG